MGNKQAQQQSSGKEVAAPVPFMPVLSRILSTRKPSPLSSGTVRILALISIRKLSSSDCACMNVWILQHLKELLFPIPTRLVMVR